MSNKLPLTERLIHLRDATGDRGYRDTLAEAENAIIELRTRRDQLEMEVADLREALERIANPFGPIDTSRLRIIARQALEGEPT